MYDTKAFFDARTSTLTYVVSDPRTRDAIVIDPVLDYDSGAATTWTESVDAVIRYLNEQRLRLRVVLETHAHADHLSGSQNLKEACPNVKVAIGRRITDVQKTFKGVFSLPADFPTDGSQFDVLLDDGELMEAGSIRVKTIATPGHTPACVTYEIGDMLFTGDALFMPDSGTGRCDFPQGSATDLYRSITERIYSKADETRIFVGHDYQPGGREVAFQTTVREEKEANVALSAEVSEVDFVAFRQRRDAQLAAPKLLFQSVQVNVAAGRLPTAEAGTEIAYLKIPVNVFKPAVRARPLTLDLCEVCEAPQLSGRQG